MTTPPLVLVTGATGYVGGRLVRVLEQRGVRVRCLARRPEFLLPRVAPDSEVVAGDVLDRASLDRTLAGVHTAYYLIHSMGAPGEFEALDRQGARNFAAAASAAGVRRIVYLGGLGEGAPSLSPHLRSRHEVGDIPCTRSAGVQVIEFRASIVIGSGSLSFEWGRLLIDSIRHATLVRDPSARDAFAVRPVGIAEAISSALRTEDQERAETSWARAVSAAGPTKAWGGTRFGNRLVDSRTTSLRVGPEAAIEPILGIGGKNGWYYGNWLWRVRGWLDLLVGGVGMRRGRPEPFHLAAGDPLDCWRIEAWEPRRRLLLAAEMKLPGRAWLEFEVTPTPSGATVRQTAVFDPVGLLGVAYWYATYPLHQLVFDGMLRGIAARATRGSQQVPARPALERG